MPAPPPKHHHPSTPPPPAAYAAAAVTGWRRQAEADLFLDPLALAYEAAVHGARSPWAHYLCMLPRSFPGLPMHSRWVCGGGGGRGGREGGVRGWWLQRRGRSGDGGV